MNKTSFLTKLSGILSVAAVVALSACLSLAQEVTVNNNDPGNSGQGTNAQSSTPNHVVRTSFEFGYRARDVNGSLEKYRSDLNYGRGFRVFDSSLYITAKESGGEPFDSLMITGSGWGADPNGYARVNMEKSGWYRFDSSVRRFTYFNNLDNFALNEHTRNTRRNVGDFDITLLPENEKFSVRFGYGFNTNDGPATWTYDYDRDEFPITSNYRSRAGDFRIGVDGELLGFHLSFTESYRRFQDDTSYSIDGPQLGNNPSPNASLSTFSRLIPERGDVFDHRLLVHRSYAKRIDFAARLIYTLSRSRFNLIDELTGRDRSGNPIVLDRSNIGGNASKPNTIGDIGITIKVTDKFHISNSFAFNSYRISGGNILLQQLIRTNAGGTPLPTVTTNTNAWRFTNYRRYMNTIEADYDLNRYFMFYVGYRYTNRRITLMGLDRNLPNGTPTLTEEMARNHTNTFIGGFKLKPIPRKWSIWLDVERGDSDNVFTRLANYDATNVRIRSTLKPTNRLSLNVSFQRKDNSNPSRTDTTPPTNFSADVLSNIFAASFDWAATDKFSLNGGYTHNRVSSVTDVIFPSTNGIGQGVSRYFLRNHFFNLDAWFQPVKRVSFFGSYRIVKDNSDGDFFDGISRIIEGSYPLSFQSPEARVIIRLTRHIDWNVGYQYYKYDEVVRQTQNYSAHLPYTSLRIYFGNGAADR